MPPIIPISNRFAETRIMRYDTLIESMKAARLPFREISIPGGGRAAVAATGGSLLGLSVDGIDENIPYVNESIAQSGWLAGKNSSQIGGLRLWFAPEYAYFWKGRPDAKALSNYHVQAGCDPGDYRFVDAGKQSVRMELSATLRDFRDGARVKFAVERVVSAAPPPVHARGLRFAGLRLQHRIELLRAAPGKRVELWHLLQIPPGSRMLVPTRGPARPLVYFNAFHNSDWRAGKDALTWHYRGTATAKIGLDLSQVTGRAGVLRPLGRGQFAAIIWQFPLCPGMRYTDGPSEAKSGDQVVQAWDGFGFGELEYHSPSVGSEDPIYAEHSLLWCYAGSLARVNKIAGELLGRTWSDE
jgi:hypothetical protein